MGPIKFHPGDVDTDHEMDAVNVPVTFNGTRTTIVISHHKIAEFLGKDRMSWQECEIWAKSNFDTIGRKFVVWLNLTHALNAAEAHINLK